MYEMSLSMDHTNEVPPIAKVSTIKNFLQMCVKLLKDPSFVNFFQNILEICKKEEERKLE
jgi:hypothetical protein